MPHPITNVGAASLILLSQVSTYDCLDRGEAGDCSGLDGLEEARMMIPSSATNFTGDLAVEDASTGEERRGSLLFPLIIERDKG